MYNEGAARIRYVGSAFLNERARPLRDIGVGVANVMCAKGFSVLDPTTATGIRGIRYGLEAKAGSVTMLDMNSAAQKVAARNAKENSLDARIIATSLQEFANSSPGRFDLIDFDPFGSIAPSVYDIFKITRDGTVVMLTATDAAVLCGAHEKACIRIYDAKPMHNELCHEVGLRILIGYVARIASQFDFGIEPVMSIAHAHYLRLVLRARSGAEQAYKSTQNLGYAYYCPSCGYRSCSASVFPTIGACGLCGSRLAIAGKLWCGRLRDANIVGEVLEWASGAAASYVSSETIKLLSALSKECDAPLYYSVPGLTKRLGVSSVSPSELVGLLLGAGFRASKVHIDPSLVRTSADLPSIIGLVKGLHASGSGIANARRMV